jgi:hypothetical protein
MTRSSSRLLGCCRSTVENWYLDLLATRRPLQRVPPWRWLPDVPPAARIGSGGAGPERIASAGQSGWRRRTGIEPARTRCSPSPVLKIKIVKRSRGGQTGLRRSQACTRCWALLGDAWSGAVMAREWHAKRAASSHVHRRRAPPTVTGSCSPADVLPARPEPFYERNAGLYKRSTATRVLRALLGCRGRASRSYLSRVPAGALRVPRVRRPGQRRAPRKWDRGSFVACLFFGLLFGTVGAVYASNLFDPQVTGTVQSCHMESTGARTPLQSTHCQVTFQRDGRQNTAEAELPKSLPAGSATQIRVHASDDIEGVATSSNFAWLLPLGLLLLVPPYIWGWPKKARVAPSRCA